MATLKTLLDTANGLYREVVDGQGYRRAELIEHMPENILTQPVTLERIDRCTYEVRFAQSREPSFVLYSRRRATRSD